MTTPREILIQMGLIDPDEDEDKDLLLGLRTEPRTGRKVRARDLESITSRFAKAPTGLGRDKVDKLPVGLPELAGKTLLEGAGAPIIGLGEQIGLAKEGSRQQIREMFETARENYLAQNPNSIGRQAAALGLDFGANLVPFVPAQTVGSAVVKTAAKVAPKFAPLVSSAAGRLLAGGIGGAAEGTLVGIGTTVGEENRGKGILGGTLLGTAFGAAGGRGAELGELAETAASRFVKKYFASPEEPMAQKIVAAAERLNMQLFDREAPVTRMVKMVTGKNSKELRHMEELIQQARTSSARSVDPVMHRTRRYREDGSVEDTGEGLIDIWGNGIDDLAKKIVSEAPAGTKVSHVSEELGRDFSAMLAAQRQLELAKKAAGGKKIKIDDEAVADAAAALDDVRSRRGDSLDGLALRFRQWTVRSFLDPLLDVGVLDEVQYKSIIDDSDLYAPFLRALEVVKAKGVDLDVETGEVVMKITQRNRGATGEGGKPIGRIFTALSTEPELQRMDIFEASATRAIQVDRFVARQRVRNEVAKLAKEFGEITGIERAETVSRTKVTREEFEGMVKDPVTGEKVGLEDAPDGVAEITRKSNRHGVNTFTSFEAGAAEAWRAPKDLVHAMSFMEPAHIPLITSVARAATRGVRAGATTLNLAFGQRNLFRDQFSLGVFTRHGAIPFYDPLVSLAQQFASRLPKESALGQTQFAIDSRKLIEEFNSSPAAFASLVSLDMVPGSLLKQVQNASRLRNKRGVSRVLTEFRNNPLKPVQVLSESLERTTRLAEFRLARKGGRKEIGPFPIPFTKKGPGASIRSAGLDAADVSLNFSRGGTVTKVWTQYEAFLNPEFQDISRFMKEMGNPERRTTVAMKLATYVTIPTIYHWWMNRGDEEYHNQPEWQKRAFFTFGKTEKGEPIMFPRPIGIINLTAGFMVEKMLDHFVAKDPEATLGLVKGIVEGTPLHFTDILALAPNLVQPLAEVQLNRDEFTDTPVTGRALEGFLPEERVGPGTSETAQFVSEAIRGFYSPVEIDHLIQGYGAGTARDFLAGAESLLGARRRPGSGTKDSATMRLTGLSGFVGRRPIGFGSKPVNDLYTLSDAASQADKSINHLLDLGNEEKALLRRSEHPEHVVAKALEGIRKELSEARKDREAIIAQWRAGDIDEDEANDKVLQLDEWMTMRAGQALLAAAQDIELEKARLSGGS